MTLQPDDIHAGPLTGVLHDALAGLRRQRVVEGILARDHKVWHPEPTEISNRLGWLNSPQVMRTKVETIHNLVDHVRAAGFTHAMLLGMGGSSLAPEVLSHVFDIAPGHLNLSVLDSTDPAAVRRAFAASDPATTLYLPATKSGGTVETLSFLKYAYRQVVATGTATPGAHFVAITDPGSGLADLAAQLSFRHTFLNDPDIGGRYSALSMFGMVPAALCGIDIAALLHAGQQAIDELTTQAEQAPSVMLGALLGVAAIAGRNKLTFHGDETLRCLGPWIEQLVAESTGKDGKGILPVDGESLGTPTAYRDDRLFILTQLSGATPIDADTIKALVDAGHPVARIGVDDRLDLGAEMVRWEIATVVAGQLLSINPFDQPNVESAKVQATKMVAAYRDTGSLPTSAPSFTDAGIDVHSDVHTGIDGRSLKAVFTAALQSNPAPDYLCLQAFLPPTPDTDAALRKLRLRLRAATQLATTVGYGPRFLHSTGQLHKGDAGGGLFVQLTCDDTRDVAIPDSPDSDDSHMSFGVLKAAQALGDAQALRDRGRRVISLHLGASVAAGLATIAAAIGSTATAIDHQ